MSCLCKGLSGNKWMDTLKSTRFKVSDMVVLLAVSGEVNTS